MMEGRTEQTKSTSSEVELRPREKRTRELAAFVRPVARITWLGSREPAEQAEPLEAQMPSMSSPAIKAMPSEPLTVKESVLPKQPCEGETISQPEMVETQEINRLFRGFRIALSKMAGFMNFSSAQTNPMMEGRFSVPARRSFSWPPPNKIGSGCSGDLMYKRPAPFGP